MNNYISKFLKYALSLLLFITIAQLSFSQSLIEFESPIDSIDNAYQTSNWEKVIDKGKEFFSILDTINIESTDSLLLISSMQVSYKMAFASAMLGKKEEAYKLAEIETIKERFFDGQLYYKLYFQYASKGCIQLIDSDFKKSHEMLDSALNIAMTQLGNNHEIYFDATENLINYYVENSEFNKALEQLQQILTYLDNKEPKPLLLARIYYNLFLVYYSRADYPAAMQCSKTSLDFIEKDKTAKNSPFAAKVNQAVGICYYQLRQYNTSKDYLHKAIAIHTNYYTEKNPELALAYDYLGRVYRMLLDVDKAIEYKVKASNIFKKLYIQDKYFGDLFINSSQIESDEQQNNRKKDGLEIVLYELLTDFNYVFGKIPARYLKLSKDIRGNQDNFKILSFARNKKYEKIIPFLTRHLRRKEQLSSIKKGNLTANYELLGNMFMTINQLDSAINYYHKALKEQLISPQTNETSVENENLSQFIITPKLIGTFSLTANCYYKIAESKQLTASENYLRALTNYLKCDSLAENTKHYLKNGRDRLIITEQMHPIYNSVINTLFNLAELSDNKDDANTYFKRAFYFSQKSKTNKLEELLIKSDAAKFTQLHETLIEEELKLSNKINFLNREGGRKKNNDHELIFYHEKFDKTTTIYKDSAHLLNEYTKQKEILIQKLNKVFENYYELGYKNMNPSVELVQKQLDPKSVLLDYHISGNNIEVFVISRNGFTAKKIVNTDIINLLSGYYAGLLSGYYRRQDFMENGYSDFGINSNKLYDYLINPIEPELKGMSKLVIIVNNTLALLPFGTLLTDFNAENNKDLISLNYLIKRFDIVYNYSSSLWLESLKKEKKYSNKPSSILAVAPVFDQVKMLAFGDKAIEKKTGSEFMNQESTQGLSPLPATRMAVDEVCSLAKSKGIRSLKRLHTEASKLLFKKEVAGKKYILIATHGKSDDENPQFSGLYFAPQSSELQDLEKSFLFSHEAYELNLVSKLTVLYACKTGVGKIRNGFGPMSISRGFMAAGSANVVHTLWNINDLSARDLVVNMYKNIFNNKSYSSSLRKSKLKMIELGIIPFHWAGLVLLGN